MQPQKCIVCGQTYSTGLHVLGCLICFPCEKKLLRPCAALSLPRRRRRALARWYTLGTAISRAGSRTLAPLRTAASDHLQ